MTVRRLNHAVLYVRDAERSARFYCDLLDFRVAYRFPGGVFLRAADSENDHDLALFGIGEQAGPSPAGRTTVGLYHLAWEVETLDELRALSHRLDRAGALVGASDHGTTKAIYAKDPDGLEFEVSWIVPLELLTDELQPVIRPLDIEHEISRYGASRSGRG